MNAAGAIAHHLRLPEFQFKRYNVAKRGMKLADKIYKLHNYCTRVPLESYTFTMNRTQPGNDPAIKSTTGEFKAHQPTTMLRAKYENGKKNNKRIQLLHIINLALPFNYSLLWVNFERARKKARNRYAKYSWTHKNDLFYLHSGRCRIRWRWTRTRLKYHHPIRQHYARYSILMCSILCRFIWIAQGTVYDMICNIQYRKCK